jgi:subtilisin family serine protease
MNDSPSFEQPDDPPGYLPGQALLRVQPDAVGASGAGAAATTRTANELPDAIVEPLDYLRRNAGLRELDPLVIGATALAGAAGTSSAAHRHALAASVTETRSPALAGFSVAYLPPRRLTRELVRHVAAAEAIEIFERVPTRWLTAAAGCADPMRNLQWGLRAIGWFNTPPPKTSDVRVGVIDSGFDARHPAFDGLDVEYDACGKGTTDVIGHGTHVTGTIAAVVDDAAGVSGIARPRLAVWKVMPNAPQVGRQFYVDPKPYIGALAAAAEMGLAAVNLSLAGTTQSETVEPERIKALLDANVNVVAASGNGYLKGNPPMYPACYDGVLAVGSIAEDGSRSEFSGSASYVDLVAPGSNILSVQPMRRSQYRQKRTLDVLSGTSMAAAHVSGALALLAARRPGWTAAERAECLRKTARKLPAMRGRERTREHGFGLLDIPAALSFKQ